MARSESVDRPENGRQLKIVAGLGSVEDYEAFVQAGADEVFCGYVPEQWMLRYGLKNPLNRREVRYYNVQAGSESELLILVDMMEVYHVPVTITLNSLSYEPEQYPMILSVTDKCRELGFEDFIVADEGLLGILTQQENERGYQGMDKALPAEPSVRIHLSGEYGELNHVLVQYWRGRGVKRFIFPRQTMISEMHAMICNLQNADSSPDRTEFEAFLMNEKCQFTGAYCNSLHCDELCHMCRVPYRPDGKIQERTEEENEGRIGDSGCGLCALWRLREAGVTHLKIVSRGNASEETIRDIRAVDTARSILNTAASEEEYIREMKRVLFPDGCSENCYYT